MFHWQNSKHADINHYITQMLLCISLRKTFVTIWVCRLSLTNNLTFFDLRHFYQNKTLRIPKICTEAECSCFPF